MILPPNGITTTYSPGSVATSDASRPASATEAYAANGTTSADAAGRNTDRVELSDRGRMMGLAAKFLGQLAVAEDVRPEKIEEARRMIESGELFSSDALRKAARNIRRLLE